MKDCCETTDMRDKLIRAMRFKVTIGGAAQEFDMEGYVCPNINCPCKEVTFYFYGANGRYNMKLFRITLNYETWRLTSTEIFDGQADYPKIIHDFVSELDDDWKSLILSERDNALANIEDSLREDIDYSGLDINSLVYYFEIYRSALGQLTFAYEDTDYLVQDYYCVNHKCKCLDVLLAFMIVKDQKALGNTVLEIRTNLKAKTHLIEKRDRHFTKEYAELLYNKLVDTLGQTGIDVLKERYFRMKKWGRECLLPYLNDSMTPNVPVKLSGSKVSRNDPCPCGSGKKYKKCCGA